MPGGPTDIPIIHTLYDAYTAWHHLLLKFPKSQRYTLGETCDRQLLQTLELVLGAASVREPDTKLDRLREASAKVDILKLLIRLSKDCSCTSNQQYLDMQSRLQEVGKMLGGWMKSIF
ncbi:four helix bundle protein [Patescibacteria group bacterium]|nr:MAG: four helix bundle protein [Patescibacteria group bacterium]